MSTRSAAARVLRFSNGSQKLGPKATTNGDLLVWNSASNRWTRGSAATSYTAPPAANTFTKLGASGVTLTDGTGVMANTLAYTANTNPGQFVSASTPGSTFTLKGAFEGSCSTGATLVLGLTVKEAGGDNQTIRFGAYLLSGVWNVQIQRFAAVATPGGVSLAGTNRFNYGTFGTPLWFQIVRTGTELEYYVSANGEDWKLVYNEPKAGFITVAQVGFWSEVSSGTAPVRVRSFSLT